MVCAKKIVAPKPTRKTVQKIAVTLKLTGSDTRLGSRTLGPGRENRCVR